jgi:hypothetical protein
MNRSEILRPWLSARETWIALPPSEVRLLTPAELDAEVTILHTRPDVEDAKQSLCTTAVSGHEADIARSYGKMHSIGGISALARSAVTISQKIFRNRRRPHGHCERQPG